MARGPTPSPWRAAGLVLRPQDAASLAKRVPLALLSACPAFLVLPPGPGLMSHGAGLVPGCGTCSAVEADRRGPCRACMLRASVWLVQTGNPLGLEVAGSGWGGVV